jgi:DNA polymerase-3 subunit delta'
VWAPEPVGHRAVVEGLWRARANGRLPHALLFHGPDGIGKFAAARWFVQGMCCEQGPGDPCGECRPCKRLAAGSFANTWILDPTEFEKDQIAVGYLRKSNDSSFKPEPPAPRETLAEFLDLRSAEGTVRAVVLRDFERANETAQNGLLKMLEEPGEDTVLLLVSSKPHTLLETVRSRCVSVGFRALDLDQTAAALARAGLVGAERVARWSQGSPGRALQLERESASDARDLLVRVLSGELDPLLATPELLSLKGEFRGKSETQKARSKARAALELIMGILRDTLAARAGEVPAMLPHGDLADRIDWSDASLAAALRRILELRGEVELNLSPEGILDRSLLCLREAARKSRQSVRRGVAR